MRRSLRSVLLLLCSLLLGVLLVGAPQRILAQAEPQQAAGQPAEQPASPDTAQTKISQPQPLATTGASATTAVFITIRDDQGLMSAAVPSNWNQVAQGEWRIAGAPAGRILSASPNQADFSTNWGTPGVALYYSTSLPAAMEPDDVLGVFDYSSTCQDGGRGTLRPAQRNVAYQIWQDCGGTGTAAAILVIAPAVRDFYAVVEVYIASVADLRALGPILRSVRFGPVTSAPDASGGDSGGDSGAGADAGGAAPTATLPPPTPVPAPTSTPVPVLATVITDRLNLRSGPSTTVPRLTVVTRGMQLTVTGQIGNCAWLRVTAADGQQGWVSGDPQFTSLGAACETVPGVENP